MQTLLNPVQSLGSSQGMSRHTESIVAVYQQQGDAIPQDGKDPTSALSAMSHSHFRDSFDLNFNKVRNQNPSEGKNMNKSREHA